MKITKIAAALSLIGASIPAFATNGMNMEGYGPVATGMGGASMAYDNGNGGMINNPATLGFMQSGTSRLDVAVGVLGPNVSTLSKDSAADQYVMPAFGYIRKDGALSWGVGMMAQGGMGTEYADGSMWGTLAPMTGGYGGGTAAALALGASRKNMSEVGVGRLMFPVAFQASDALNIGGSIDYVWAGMDIKWLIDGAHFGDMTAAGSQRFGSVTGAGTATLGNLLNPAGMCAGGCINDVGWGYFDFEKSGKFGQQAKGSGWAMNLGLTYKVSPQLTVGGSYHAKTHLSDLTTGNNNASVAFNVNLTAAGALAFGMPAGQATLNVPGKVTVRNFQWPETYGFGFAYQANNQWMIAADYKRINWADVMKNFSMRFEGSLMGMDMGMDMNFKQDWKNQNVFQIGAAYKYSDALTIRFGGNFANNPVPDQYMSPLFPAIIKNHLTAGVGYAFSKASSLDFSLTHAPKVTVTNSWAAIGAGSNQTTTHSQTNWQLMYGYRF